VGQQVPSTPAANDVEDGIEDLAQGVYPRATGARVGGEVRLKTGPLGIGEVGLVCSSDHARYFTELLPQNPFSDSFSMEFSEVHSPLYLVTHFVTFGRR
jgi:hypothetical protein